MALYRLCGVVLFGALIDAVKDFTSIGCYLATGPCPHPNVTFWHRTRDVEGGVKLSYDMLGDMPLMEDKPLVILIHGYTGHKDYSPNMELVPEYLAHGGYNVISVDWGQMAQEGCYIQAAFNVAVAGRCIAAFLREFYLQRGDGWRNRTHVVGFSLGAHVSGVVGFYLMGKIPRITGLDPALPFFTSHAAQIQDRLDITDANYVDVYHSNAGWKGRLSALGHADFYINDGRNQPGCGSNSSCNHVRAVEVFAESINSKDGFFGEPCTVNVASFISGLVSEACTKDETIDSNDVLAGEHLDLRVRGTYKIETNEKPPFAKGLNYQNSIDRQLYFNKYN